MGNWKADLSFVARTELDGECAAFLWSFALAWDTLLGQPCRFHWLNLNQDISKLAALPLRSESMGFCIFNGLISPLFACIVPIAKQRGGGNSWLNSYLFAAFSSPLVSKPCTLWCPACSGMKSPMCSGETGARTPQTHSGAHPTQFTQGFRHLLWSLSTGICFTDGLLTLARISSKCGRSLAFVNIPFLV